MATSNERYPITRQEEDQLHEDLVAVEELLDGIAILMRACYGEGNQVAVRADETLCALQRFKWEFERLQQNAKSGVGDSVGTSR